MIKVILFIALSFIVIFIIHHIILFINDLRDSNKETKETKETSVSLSPISKKESIVHTDPSLQETPSLENMSAQNPPSLMISELNQYIKNELKT